MMKKRAALHWRDLRLLVNAGLAFPVCLATVPRLDFDRANLNTTPDPHKVTCKNCLARMRKAKGN